MKDNNLINEELIRYKELSCKLYEDGHFESGVNVGLSYEEAIRMILELQLYCCDNLKRHPLLLQADLHNVLLDHLFAEIPNEVEQNEGEDSNKLIS